MAFVWKDRKDIFKGEGVYHVTFAVEGRVPLLGELQGLASDVARPSVINEKKRTSSLATVQLTPFGFAVSDDLRSFEERHDGVTVCAKQLMPDHLHVVLWVKKNTGRSILQDLHGFQIGVTNIAKEMGVWPPVHVHNGEACDAVVGAHVFSKPFVRTLSHKGQLRSMIDYVHANPDNAWMRRLHPEMYVIRRNVVRAGLRFDAMGKARLLDYPDRQVVALSRSLTDSEIQQEVHKALLRAEQGAVTYTAAINVGERTVARRVREAGYPLVVMMLDGFPAEGSETARYFHPSGVYHNACGLGLLYLMAPYKENYDDSRLIERTDAELQRKAEAKGYHYVPNSYDSPRWRMVAGNVMLEMIGEEV